MPAHENVVLDPMTKCPITWSAESMVPVSLHGANSDGLMGESPPKCELQYFDNCFTSVFDRTLTTRCQKIPLMMNFRRIVNEFSRLAQTGHGDKDCLYSINLISCEKMNHFGIRDTIEFLGKFQALADVIFATCGKSQFASKWQPVINELKTLATDDCATTTEEPKTAPPAHDREMTTTTSTTTTTTDFRFWFVGMTTEKGQTAPTTTSTSTLTTTTTTTTTTTSTTTFTTTTSTFALWNQPDRFMGAEMEKLLQIENKLLFKIEQKISEISNPLNSLTKNHVQRLRKALGRIENERNLSKLLSLV